MAEKAFDDLPIDEKFKVVRQDIRNLGTYTRNFANEVEASLSELRSGLQKLSDRISALERQSGADASGHS